ncbi:MAG: hypothetical protein ACODAA_08170 [Gemmatimonadota bacterium]
MDQSNARYSVFDTTGTFRTSHRRRINAFVRPWPGSIDREGRIHDVTVGPTTTRVVRFDADFSSADTFELPEFDQERYQIPIAGGMMSMSLPFAPSLVSRLDSDGRLWWGTSDRYRVHQVGFAGDTLRIIEREWDPAPVSAEEHEDALDRFESAADEVESRVPSVKPAFDKIHVDDRDHVWIIPQVAGEEPGRYADIFDPDGRYLGRLTLPLRLPSSPVRFRDGQLYTVVAGELDVPYVLRLRILRR